MNGFGSTGKLGRLGLQIVEFEGLKILVTYKFNKKSENKLRTLRAILMVGTRFDGGYLYREMNLNHFHFV